jgi:hypothetical protein
MGELAIPQQDNPFIQENVVFENYLSSMGFLGFIIVPVVLAYGFDLLKTVLIHLLPAAPAAATPAANANTFTPRKSAGPRQAELADSHESATRETPRKDAPVRAPVAEAVAEHVMVGPVDLQEFDYAEFRSADSSQ